MKLAVDVPQRILDTLNDVDWRRAGNPATLARQMKAGGAYLRLRKKVKGRNVPSAGPQAIAPDVPQEILDVINAFAWTGLDHRRIAAQLAGQIAKRKLPYKGE